MNVSNEQQESDRAERSGEASKSMTGGTVARTVAFFAFWLVLTGADPADLAAGAVAAIAATWTSISLMPQQHWDVRPLKVAGLLLRFLRQTIVAGVDVALRALDPRLPLRPGVVTYHPLLPPGTKRNTFCAITSLLPGTLPSGLSRDGGLAIHCLDVTQPVATQLATEETLFVEAFGGPQDND